MNRNNALKSDFIQIFSENFPHLKPDVKVFVSYMYLCILLSPEYRLFIVAAAAAISTEVDVMRLRLLY